MTMEVGGAAGRQGTPALFLVASACVLRAVPGVGAGHDGAVRPRGARRGGRRRARRGGLLRGRCRRAGGRGRLCQPTVRRRTRCRPSGGGATGRWSTWERTPQAGRACRSARTSSRRTTRWARSTRRRLLRTSSSWPTPARRARWRSSAFFDTATMALERLSVTPTPTPTPCSLDARLDLGALCVAQCSGEGAITCYRIDRAGNAPNQTAHVTLGIPTGDPTRPRATRSTPRCRSRPPAMWASIPLSTSSTCSSRPTARRLSLPTSTVASRSTRRCATRTAE